MRLKLAMAAALVLAARPLAVPAATSTLTASVPVAGSVRENCTISASIGLGFGAYDEQINLNLDLVSNQSGYVAVICTVGSTYTLSPSRGARFMTGPNAGGSDHLNYLWAIDQGGGPFNATNFGESYSISGSVVRGQNVHHGKYADTGGITITVAISAAP